MSSMRSAERTRRGYLRCMAMPSQYAASSFVIASVPSMTERMLARTIDTAAAKLNSRCRTLHILIGVRPCPIRG